MIRPENKNISNEHPFAKKAKVERIQVADVFNLRDYDKYVQAVRDDNVLEVFPDEDIFKLERLRKIYEKQLTKDKTDK